MYSGCCAEADAAPSPFSAPAAAEAPSDSAYDGGARGGPAAAAAAVLSTDSHLGTEAASAILTDFDFDFLPVIADDLIQITSGSSGSPCALPLPARSSVRTRIECDKRRGVDQQLTASTQAHCHTHITSRHGSARLHNATRTLAHPHNTRNQLNSQDT